MRKLSQITATIVPYPSAPRTFGRRPLSSVVGHLTCLVLFKHGETETCLIVSDDNDHIGAVSIPKALIELHDRFKGRFVVATLSAHIARTKGLGTPLIERATFLPEELSELNDAFACAKRTRDRLCGHVQQCATWRSGNLFA